jgi:beta-carotene/zeaxanthin 4-ketolase
LSQDLDVGYFDSKFICEIMWHAGINLRDKSKQGDLFPGIFISLSLFLLWLGSLACLLSLDISQISIVGVIAAVFVRTFLHTGLFITAHDAMHRTVFPQSRKVNDLIGAIATTAYALLSFQTLAQKHRLHHQHPASSDDPDFCEDYENKGDRNASSWYLKFMGGYLERKQLWILLVGMILIFTALSLGFHISVRNLILFWVLPIFLSSIQLFYFGTYLPHRRLTNGYDDRHRARSSNYSIFWSFLACYHFGYHWEHHEYPHLPWYMLPSAKWK